MRMLSRYISIPSYVDERALITYKGLRIDIVLSLANNRETETILF